MRVEHLTTVLVPHVKVHWRPVVFFQRGEHGDAGKSKTCAAEELHRPKHPESLADDPDTEVMVCRHPLIDLCNTKQRRFMIRICVTASRLPLCRMVSRTSAD